MAGPSVSEPKPAETGMRKADSSESLDSKDVKDVPMHKELLHSKSRPSLLTEKKSNYSGFVNVAIMLLVLANFRLMLTNMQKYGVLLSLSPLFRFDPSYPIVAALMFSLLLHALAALFIEKSIARSKNTGFYRGLHWLNLTLSIGLSTVVVWVTEPNPGASTVELLMATMTFLKLTSYVIENARARAEVVSAKKSEAKSQAVTTDAKVLYPGNLSLRDMVYFLAAPTLRYNLNYPRSESIRRRRVLRHIVELLALSALILLIVEQYILPLLANAVLPFSRMDWSSMLERWLKLAVPNFYVWFLGFFCFFHLYLNIVAEVLRFGDRMFYRDWWNATTVDYFWKNWNIPTYHWLLNYVYVPLVNRRVSKSVAALVVFFVSAVFHELLVSVPFHSIKGLGFGAMMMQIPLSIITRPLRNTPIGNFIVWGSLVLGQPLCVLVYYYDWSVRNSVGL